MKRYAALTVTVFLVFAACGGGDDATQETVDTVELADVVDATTLSAIDSAIGELGPEGAFTAVLFAMDDGYDANQITDGMANGSLGSDGSIAGVAPSGAPFGLIDRSGSSAYGDDVVILAAGADLVLAQGQVSVQDVKTNFLPDLAGLFGIDAEDERKRSELSRNAGKAIIGTLMVLAGAGYSFDQLVEHLVFGSDAIVVKPSGGGICPTIDGADALVAPARNPDYLEPGHPCIAWYNSLRSGTSSATTTATETTSADTSAATTTVNDAGGDFSFGARLEGDGMEWVWTGAFSIVGDQLVGNGTVTGSADTTCSIEGGPEYPVAFTGSGRYDIAGTAGASTMSVILSPTEGNLNVTTGDTSQLCVEVSIEVAEILTEFPMGNVELTEVPLELPLGGGQTSLDFGGFVFDVTVSAN